MTRGFLEQLSRATGQENIEIWYESELARELDWPSNLKEFRARIESIADLVPLPDILTADARHTPGQVFLLVSTSRGGFLVRVWRLRAFVPRESL